MNVEGLTTRPSRYGVRETMDRLAAEAAAHGMTILARIDHAGAAAQAGLDLRPTEVLIFGNPRAGTPLMQVVQTIGIDLPLKALVWEDAAGATWLAYNDPAWLARRHVIGAMPILGAMEAALASAVEEATGVKNQNPSP